MFGNLKKEATYWDFRHEEVESNSVVVWNKNVKNLNYNIRQGASIRVLYGKGWGFAAGEIEKKQELSEKALKIAKIMDKISKSKVILAPANAEQTIKKIKMRTDVRDISLAEKKEMCIRECKSTDERIKSVQTLYSDSIKHKIFENSEGADIEQELVYTYCGCSCMAQENGIMENYDIKQGITGGYEITNMMHNIAEKCAKSAINLLKSEIPKGGKFPVICDGVLTDVIIHEALGHASEADIVNQGASFLKRLHDKKIASSIVNIYDDATVKKGWGSYFYDDEGVKAKKNKLVEKGILKSFLHSRESAGLLGKCVTGNGRAQDVFSVPQVRMSNTYIEKGKDRLPEMIAEVKNGFFLKGSKGGQVDTCKGEFHFNAVEGFKIKDGELAERVKGVSLGGNALKVLMNVTHIANKYEKGMAGFCGKGGQSVPVRGDCPAILIKRAAVGGR